MAKKQQEQKSWAEVFNGQRRTWQIDPRTRVVPDKTKYNRKEKHKGKNKEEE